MKTKQNATACNKRDNDIYDEIVAYICFGLDLRNPLMCCYEKAYKYNQAETNRETFKNELKEIIKTAFTQYRKFQYKGIKYHINENDIDKIASKMINQNYKIWKQRYKLCEENK